MGKKEAEKIDEPKVEKKEPVIVPDVKPDTDKQVEKTNPVDSVPYHRFNDVIREREQAKLELKEYKESVKADLIERDELKKYKEKNEVKVAEEKVTIRKQFIEKHDKIKDHKDYGGCKVHFTLPEEKDGKSDWTEVDDDAMVANMNKLKEQEGYGLFGDGTGGHGEPKGGKKGDNTDKKHYPTGTFK